MINIFSLVDTTNINHHYWNRYQKFIQVLYNKGKRDLKYKEIHHIIPRCIDDSLYENYDNKIELTPREHYIAHIILSHCYLVGTNEYNRLIFALFAMSKLRMRYHTRQDIVITARQYEKLRIRYSEARRSYMQVHVNDGRYEKLKGKGQPAHNKGKISITNGMQNHYIDKNDVIPEGWYRGNTQKKRGDSWKASLKQSWIANRTNRVGKNHPMYGKGYLLTNESNGTYNKKCMHKDGKNIFVDKELVNDYLLQGYTLGQLRKDGTMRHRVYIFKDDIVKCIDVNYKQMYIDDGGCLGNPKASKKGNKNSAYGKICINNGIKNMRVYPQDLNKYISLGYVKGLMRYKN